MTIQPKSTPEQDWEWILCGLFPKGALAVLDADIERLTEQIRQTQVELSHTHLVRRRLLSGKCAVDENGCLTYSPDNPLAQ